MIAELRERRKINNDDAYLSGNAKKSSSEEEEEGEDDEFQRTRSFVPPWTVPSVCHTIHYCECAGIISRRKVSLSLCCVHL